MIDHRGCIIAKCHTDHHSQDMTASSVVSATYMAIENIDDNNFATDLSSMLK